MTAALSRKRERYRCPTIRAATGRRRLGWLDDDPSGMRGVLKDAVSLYFADATLSSAFVARWCVGSKVETTGGVYRVREDGPALRVHGCGAIVAPHT